MTITAPVRRPPRGEPTPRPAPTAPPTVRRSAVGPPEVIDTARRPGVFALVMACVVAGLALSLWALTDSLQNGASVELVRLDVPSVSGMEIDEARATLERTGFVVDVQFQPNEVQPKGAVIGQKPLAGSRIEQGSLVVVLASDGPLGTSVPDVAGQSAPDALATMLASGLLVEQVPTSNETIRAGEVLGTEPPIGRRVPPGATVRMLVSSGPAPRTVPPVIDLPIGQALAELGRNGLAVGDIDEVFREDLAPGTVFEADPPPGSNVPRDTPVSIKVAEPKPTVIVPYFVGLHRAAAVSVARINDVRINVVTTPVPTGDPTEGRIVAQGVPPQTEINADIVVELKVAVVQAPVPAESVQPPPGG